VPAALDDEPRIGNGKIQHHREIRHHGPMCGFPADDSDQTLSGSRLFVPPTRNSRPPETGKGIHLGESEQSRGPASLDATLGPST
jgi:hypothetical protein